MSTAKHVRAGRSGKTTGTALRRWLAAGAAAALVGASAIASSPPALAASEPDQSGTASLLDATVLGLPVGDVVNGVLNPVTATASGATTGLVDGDSLADVNIGGIQLLGSPDSQPLLGFESAINSVVLDPGGVSSADSTVAGLSINVSQILDQTPLAAAFSELSLNIDALSSNTTAPAGSDPSGSTSLAGATIDAASPVVSAITTTLSTAIGPGSLVQNTLNTITGLVDSLPGGPTINVDLATLMGPILDDPFTANGVTINPATGEISFDLDQILGSQITDPAVNTELFSPETINLITDALAAAVDSYTQALTQAITDAVSGVSVTFQPVAGTGLSGTTTLGQLMGLDPTPINLAGCAPLIGCSLPAGPILDVITAPLAVATSTLQTAVQTAVNTAVDPLVSVLSPAIGLIDTVIGVTLNEQTTPAVEGEPYTTTALSVDILGGAIANLSIANATVDAAALPFITSADEVPAGGTTPVDGVGFSPGETVTVQLLDPEGNPVGDPVTVVVGDDGTFSTTLPVPPDAVPGDYTISATGP